MSAKIQVTIEVLTEIEGKDYPKKENIYTQISPVATDQDVLNIIKAVNGLSDKV